MSLSSVDNVRVAVPAAVPSLTCNTMSLVHPDGGMKAAASIRVRTILLPGVNFAISPELFPA